MKEKFYGDWEKTPAKIIPIVKVDPFYQEARDGLVVDKIHCHSFLAETPGIIHPLVSIDLKAWRYLDILTDGGINPQNNFNTHFQGNSICQLRFDDGYVHNINGEIHNLPLVNKKTMEFHNVRGQSQLASLPNETVETGYGNVYFILKKYPFVRSIRKHNPNYCISQIDVDAAAVVYYWFGIDRVDIAYLLGIPYIPKGYKYINVLINTDATTYDCWINQYSMSMCDNNNLGSSPTLAKQTPKQGVLVTDRFSLYFKNNDAATKTFQFNLYTVLKSDNG